MKLIPMYSNLLEKKLEISILTQVKIIDENSTDI